MDLFLGGYNIKADFIIKSLSLLHRSNHNRGMRENTGNCITCCMDMTLTITCVTIHAGHKYTKSLYFNQVFSLSIISIKFNNDRTSLTKLQRYDYIFNRRNNVKTKQVRPSKTLASLAVALLSVIQSMACIRCMALTNLDPRYLS